MGEFSEFNNDPLYYGPGVAENGVRPWIPVECQQTYGSQKAYFIGPETETPTIYLTFDEGYESIGRYSVKILDTLKEKGVQAVFFITGTYLRDNPELVERMLAEGHTVGNHTWSHLRMPTLSVEKQKNDILRTHDLMLEKFGYEMKFFRYPEGVFSQRTNAVCASLGYTSVMWSYCYKDWDQSDQMDPAKALPLLLKHHHNGAIYLLHAVSSTNAAILGDLIDSLRDMGYSFGVLPPL